MKNIILIIGLLISSCCAFGQAPFTTLVKEPRFLERTLDINRTERFYAVIDTNEIKSIVNNTKKSVDVKKIETKKNDIDFFKSNGLTLI